MGPSVSISTTSSPVFVKVISNDGNDPDGNECLVVRRVRLRLASDASGEAAIGVRITRPARRRQYIVAAQRLAAKLRPT